MNYTKILFSSFAIVMWLVGTLIILLEPYLPTFVTRTYRFGKFADKLEHPIVIQCEVPKRWFAHYYMFAVPFSMNILIITLYKFLYNGNEPQILQVVLDFMLGATRQALVSPESTILVMILITIHACKRLYETKCISIFSDAKMNVIHYMLGYIHYFSLLIAIIGETSGFVKGTQANFDWNKITYLQYICAIILLWASFKQLKTNLILVNLRKDKNKSSFVTQSYKIPYGDLFEYVSSPLQSMEMLIYICLSIILSSSSTFHYITYWVLSNQLFCAILNQQWYCKTFKNYPTSRRIVIPFIF